MNIPIIIWNICGYFPNYGTYGYYSMVYLNYVFGYDGYFPNYGNYGIPTMNIIADNCGIYYGIWYDRKTMEIPIMIIMEWCEWKGIPGVLAAWPVLRCLWYKWWIFCCQLGCLELYVASSGIFMLTTRQMLRVVLGKWTVGCIVHAWCQIWWCNLTMSIRGSCPHALSGTRKTFMTFQLFRFIHGDRQGRKESQIQNFANLLLFLFIQGLIESWIFFLWPPWEQFGLFLLCLSRRLGMCWVSPPSCRHVIQDQTDHT